MACAMVGSMGAGLLLLSLFMHDSWDTRWKKVSSVGFFVVAFAGVLALSGFFVHITTP